MNNLMRVIAKAGGYTVIQDCNGVISISKDNGQYICCEASAYEMIRGVKEPAVRAELLRQWEEDLKRQTHAEKNSKEAEFRG